MQILYLRILILIFFAALTGCYSAEFFPATDYPILKKKVENVELRWTEPVRPYHILGRLVIRDFTGNIEDENFLRYLRHQAMDRGAEGIVIVQSQTKQVEYLRGYANDPRRGSYQRQETGRLDGNLSIVTAILFNYR